MSETKCVASPHGKHERGDDRDDSSWWCVWCSAEMGADTTPADAPTPRETGAGEGEYSAEYSTECARCGTQPLNYPKPLQSLGEYLTGLLDDDQWAKAEGMLHDLGRLLNIRPDAASASVTEAMVLAAYRVIRDEYKDRALISPTAVRNALEAASALAAAPRDAGREEDRIDAERWRAVRPHLRIMGGESHPFVEFLEPNGFIDEEDFVDDNGAAITPEPTFEQLLDRYRAARQGATG